MYRLLCSMALAVLGTSAADPMRPDPVAPNRGPENGVAAQNTDRLTLSSVYILDDQAFAVINGQWLSTEDRLGDYRVVSIEPDQVVLQSAGQQRRLTPSQNGSLSISPINED